LIKTPFAHSDICLRREGKERAQAHTGRERAESGERERERVSEETAAAAAADKRAELERV
jgi:hypothetical protein